MEEGEVLQEGEHPKKEQENSQLTMSLEEASDCKRKPLVKTTGFVISSLNL